MHNPYKPNPSDLICLHFKSFYQSYVVTFKTLKEASSWAQEISKICPNPNHAALGLTELFINAIEHGNLNITSEDKDHFEDQVAWLKAILAKQKAPEHKEKAVHVVVEILPAHVRVKVSDQGKGFSWSKIKPSGMTEPLAKHGRGILLAKAIGTDQLLYHGRGNHVECYFIFAQHWINPLLPKSNACETATSVHPFQKPKP